MHFVKMHGLGNDFVVVVAMRAAITAPGGLARALCDRHRGIGADGLLVVMPADPGVGADLRMRVFNADGSEAEMCGNGIRCVCKLAFDDGLCRASPMRIQTGRGVLPLTYTVAPSGGVDSVTVGMGEPSIAPIDGLRVKVSMGNPHLVIFCDDVLGVALETLGPVLERDPAFPERTNVHFAQVVGAADVLVRTWERGSGATLACGTGAAAVCAAAAFTGRTGRKIRARLPGGDLELDWRGDGQMWMTGPAARVFEGAWLP